MLQKPKRCPSISGALTLILLAAVIVAVKPATAQAAGPSWTWANPTPQGNNLNASTSGGAISVAVGGNGTIYSNASGSWARVEKGLTTQSLYAVAYGNGTFVAVGQADTILYSTDGVHWTKVPVSDTTQNLYAIAFGGNSFVAVGSDDIEFTSSNGSTWTQGYITGSKNTDTATDLAYGANVFVAVTHSVVNKTLIYYGSVASGSSTISWHAASLSSTPTDPSINIAYNGSEFLAMGLNISGSKGASILTSPGGKTWTLQSPLSPTTSFPVALTANGTDFVAVLQAAPQTGSVTTPIEIETTSNGASWANAGQNNLPDTWSQSIPRSISYSSAGYLVVGASAYLASSPDLVNWTAVSPTSTVTYQHLRGIHWLNGQFYAVGDHDTILTSPRGIVWTNEHVSVSDPSNLRDIAYGNGTYVAVGSGGVVLTSSNGTNWTSGVISSATATGLEGIAWNGKLFAAVGLNGAIYTSPDGISWTPQSSGTTSNLWGVVWTGKAFVATGDSNGSSPARILTSTNGTSWSIVPFNSGHVTSLYGISWNGNELIVAGGATNSSGVPVAIIGTTTSADGTNWTVDDSSLSDTFADALLVGSTYVAVGQTSGYVYSSANGTSWTNETPNVEDDGLQYVGEKDGTVAATGYAGAMFYATYQPPSAVNGSTTTSEDTPVSGALASTGGTLSFQIATQPVHGKVNLNTATGAFTYTPNTGFSGSDSFTFTATNSAGTSSAATENITVQPKTAPPATQNGSVTTPENQAVSGSLQATGSPTSFKIVNQPAHGKVSLNTATGAFTYTPNTGFSGSDSFTFTASNSGGTSNTSTESITVTAASSGGGGTTTSGSGGSSGGGGGSLGGLTLLALLGIAWSRRRFGKTTG